VPAPRGASSDGPPAPRRLEQPFPPPHPSLTSLVIVAGTATPAPYCRREASRRARPFGLTFRRSPARPRPPTPSRLAERRGSNQDAFDRASSRRESPRGGIERALSVWRAPPGTRTVFASKPPRRVSARLRSAPRLAPCRPAAPCGSSGRRTRRCVGPISAISLSYVPVPASRRFPARQAIARSRAR